LASSRQRYPLRRYVNVAVRQNSKAQDCVTKTIRDPFTTQFTPMPRGKIAYLAASFRHIGACARGETPIVAAPPPFPTRDFLPWRFSAASRRSAWRDRHPGSRKPTQKETSALALHSFLYETEEAEPARSVAHGATFALRCTLVATRPIASKRCPGAPNRCCARHGRVMPARRVYQPHGQYRSRTCRCREALARTIGPVRAASWIGRPTYGGLR
jgi:hypothetical protein